VRAFNLSPEQPSRLVVQERGQAFCYNPDCLAVSKL